MKKSCGNCVNCLKGSEFWSCENYSHSVGMPVKVSPPYDEPCSNWSDNPKNRDKSLDGLRDFVDHFWDNHEEEDES